MEFLCGPFFVFTPITSSSFTAEEKILTTKGTKNTKWSQRGFNKLFKKHFVALLIAAVAKKGCWVE
jgi:hypothetical protein